MKKIEKEMRVGCADAFAFKSKKEGFITISRHAMPDFCAGMTIKNILKQYYVVAIYFDDCKPEQLGSDETTKNLLNILHKKGIIDLGEKQRIWQDYKNSKRNKDHGT